MKKSINKKILTLLVCAMVMSTLIVGGVSIITTNNFSIASGEREVGLICENSTQEINKMINRIAQSVTILGDNALDQLGSVSVLLDDESREEYTERMREIIRTSAVNTKGCVAAYLRFNPDFTPPTSGVFMQKENGVMKDLVPTDFSIYDSTDVEHVGWYYLPINSKEPLWMDPYYNKNIDIHMISYVIPLYSGGKAIGVIGMDIDFDYITELVNSIMAYDSGTAFLLSGDTVQWHPTIESGEYFSFDPDMVYSESRVDNGMKLVLEVPKKEIFYERNRLLITILMLSSAILIISILIVSKTASSITKPLRELTEKAKKLSAGSMDIDFAVDSNDEVGVLANTMQETVRSLKQYIDFTNGLAFADSLTGIKNKTAYDSYVERMNGEIASGRAEPFAIAMCDINELKNINDTFGHEYGNVLIINSCRFICKSFKRSPVFRIGGDEFVVVLKNDDYINRHEKISEMREMMYESNNNPIPYERISIAIGFSEFEPGKDSNMDEIFKRADINMYEEKKRFKDALSRLNASEEISGEPQKIDIHD